MNMRQCYTCKLIAEGDLLEVNKAWRQGTNAGILWRFVIGELGYDQDALPKKTFSNHFTNGHAGLRRDA